jgi:hypothetical protein
MVETLLEASKVNTMPALATEGCVTFVMRLSSSK